MFLSLRSLSTYIRLACLMIATGIILASCGTTTNKASRALTAYDRAKDAFKDNHLDKALELTDKLARATPPAEHTDRARVLRAVIYTGEMKSSCELAEAYGKGAENAKNPRFQSAYRRLRGDHLSNATKSALNLAETAHQIAPDGAIPKELTLETNFPTTQGPTQIHQLSRVQEGAWIEPEEQEMAAADALRKGVDDALADVVSGDRSKARQALASGSAKLPGTDFAIFLAKQLADGAMVFDRHHARDTMKMKMLCDQGNLVLKAALDLLKDAPDKDQEKEVKKLQDKFKTILKNT